MITPADRDRRQFPRFPAVGPQLTVSGRPARLVDWSFGGIGVRLDGGVDGFDPGEPVEIRVRRRATDRWETLRGQVARVDAPESLLGMALDDDGSGSVRVLIELLATRLDEMNLA